MQNIVLDFSFFLNFLIPWCGWVGRGDGNINTTADVGQIVRDKNLRSESDA